MVVFSTIFDLKVVTMAVRVVRDVKVSSNGASGNSWGMPAAGTRTAPSTNPTEIGVSTVAYRSASLWE